MGLSFTRDINNSAVSSLAALHNDAQNSM